MSQSIPLELSSKKYDDISKRIHSSYPESCILWIEEIKNPGLEEKHETLLATIKSKRTSIEIKKLELFHGTSESAVQSICDNGFNVELNNTSMYGKGTYFAKNASYSIEYSKKRAKEGIVYMLLCSVIVGSIKTGKSNMVIDADTDITVDNIHSPTIFVTPYDNGGIPKYVVAFYT